jgi:hypothetical protein
MWFNRIMVLMVNRAGLQIELAHPKRLFDVPELVVTVYYCGI